MYHSHNYYNRHSGVRGGRRYAGYVGYDDYVVGYEEGGYDEYAVGGGYEEGGYVDLAPAIPHVTSSHSLSTVNAEPAYTRDPELASILECPICYGVPEKEVFLCEGGHSICGTCRPRLTQCALCTAPIRGSRNFVVESLIAHFKKMGVPLDGTTRSSRVTMTNCVNKNEGCQKLILNWEADAHVNECEFRPVYCVTCPQRTLLKLSDYFNHLLQKHKILGLTEPSGVFTKTERLYRRLELDTIPFYLQYDGKTFVLNGSLQNKTLSWWIQLIGPDSESRKYKATISLQSPKNPNVKASWTVPVFSIRCDNKTIAERNIAAIPFTNVVQFCSLNQLFEGKLYTHTWNCHITLSRWN